MRTSFSEQPGGRDQAVRGRTQAQPTPIECTDCTPTGSANCGSLGVLTLLIFEAQQVPLLAHTLSPSAAHANPFTVRVHSPPTFMKFRRLFDSLGVFLNQWAETRARGAAVPRQFRRRLRGGEQRKLLNRPLRRQSMSTTSARHVLSSITLTTTITPLLQESRLGSCCPLE